ncbi:uncharacterized protein [Antedon mediterranea]|uniref:uncharacterized protein n=1 Tax=Antedon mediterranea TaxID=105859 RepID=UPI003AF6CA6E
MEVLSYLRDQLQTVCNIYEGSGYKLHVVCDACNPEEHHLVDLEKCLKKDVITCGTDTSMNTAHIKRYFSTGVVEASISNQGNCDESECATLSHQRLPSEESEANEAKQPVPVTETKPKSEPGSVPRTNEEHEPVPVHVPSPGHQDLSDNDFRQMIKDFAQLYDENELLNRLKVLFIEMLDDVEAVKKVTTTIELLTLLSAKGLLSRTNLSLLYDAIKVTQQFGFQSVIQEKLSSIKRKRRTVAFSGHTIKIFNLGKSLSSDSDITTLDILYNFHVLKKYADRCSLILDLESQGLLSEDKLESIKKDVL